MPGVLLGNIQFVDHEIPDVMKAGSKQMLAIHKLMGGSRVIDTIGPDFPPIRWSGLFYGANAMARARVCDNLCQSGSEVNLYWGSNAYVVVVEDFDYDYKHEWEVRYSISCVVVGTSAGAQPLSIDSAISNDFAAIDGIATAAPAAPAVDGSVSIPAATLSTITNARTTIDSATSGSIANLSLTQLQPSVNATASAVQTLQSALVTPTGINLDVNPPGANSILDGFNALVTEVSRVAQQSDQEIALAYLGRILGNLTTLAG